MRLGFHVSIGGGMGSALQAARRRRCQTIQVFTTAPSAWVRRKSDPQEDADFVTGCRESNITPVFVHAPYLLNVASADRNLWRRSVSVLARELEMANKWDAAGVVLHLGSAGDSSMTAAIRRAAKAIREARSRTAGPAKLIIENCAGAGSMVGYTMAQLGEIIATAEPERIAVCVDTAHAFAAGYAIHTADGIEQMLAEAEQAFSLDLIELIHLNDSKSALGSRVDRHEHIARGQIGRDGFAVILTEARLAHLPFIMETPKTPGNDLADDLGNLRRVRRIIPRHLRPPLPPPA
jgi:deoxyribonuclease IV